MAFKQCLVSTCHAGEPLRLLEGIPLAIKDNLSTRGLRTSCASRMLMDYDPAYDATIIERSLREGSVTVGKANMDEFALG